MWLLNTRTIELEQFFEGRTPPYAILSHTWENEEVTFQEMQTNQRSSGAKAGYKKILAFCAAAVSDGFEYAWIDTCW
jgi:hypothetical protein